MPWKASASPTVSPNEGDEDSFRRLEQALVDAHPVLRRIELRARAGNGAGKFPRTCLHKWDCHFDESDDLNALAQEVFSIAERHEENRRCAHTFQVTIYGAGDDGKTHEIDQFTFAGFAQQNGEASARQEALAVASHQTKTIKALDDIIVRQHKQAESLVTAIATLGEQYSKLQTPMVEVEKLKIEVAERREKDREENENVRQTIQGLTQALTEIGKAAAPIVVQNMNREAKSKKAARLHDIVAGCTDEQRQRVRDLFGSVRWGILQAMAAAHSDEHFDTIGKSLWAQLTEEDKAALVGIIGVGVAAQLQELFKQ